MGSTKQIREVIDQRVGSAQFRYFQTFRTTTFLDAGMPVSDALIGQEAGQSIGEDVVIAIRLLVSPTEHLIFPGFLEPDHAQIKRPSCVIGHLRSNKNGPCSAPPCHSVSQPSSDHRIASTATMGADRCIPPSPTSACLHALGGAVGDVELATQLHTRDTIPVLIIECIKS